MGFKKGQYFSFDAIIASVIFMLGMSLLLGQWFAVRSATDLSNDYLIDDAFRASDILMAPGVPDGTWYDEFMLPTLSGGIKKVGFGTSANGGVMLNHSILAYVNDAWMRPDLWSFSGYPTPYYNSFRTMLGVGTHIDGFICSTERAVVSGFPVCMRQWHFGFNDARLGAYGAKVSERAMVRRIVVVNDSSHAGRPLIATMDISLYRNTTSTN